MVCLLLPGFIYCYRGVCCSHGLFTVPMVGLLFLLPVYRSHCLFTVPTMFTIPEVCWQFPRSAYCSHCLVTVPTVCLPLSTAPIVCFQFPKNINFSLFIYCLFNLFTLPGFVSYPLFVCLLLPEVVCSYHCLFSSPRVCLLFHWVSVFTKDCLHSHLYYPSHGLFTVRTVCLLFTQDVYVLHGLFLLLAR